MDFTLVCGDVFSTLPELDAESIDLCLTSPPYWGLRDYGVDGQLGAEPTMEEYLDNLMRWTKEVYRVLKPTGSFVLNLAGCYVGGSANSLGRNSLGCGSVAAPLSGKYKEKQFLDVAAFAYCRIISETGFVCRNRCVWCKPNVPSPIRSRLKQSWESMDWFVKDADEYYWDPKPWLKKAKARDGKENFTGGICSNGDKAARRNVNLKERNNVATEDQSATPGKYGCGMANPETIEHAWRVVPVGEKQKGFELSGKAAQLHVAPFPEALVRPWIESLCPPGGIVLDPFIGSGTVMKIARDTGRSCIGIDLDAKTLAYAKKRVNWGETVSGSRYLEKKQIGGGLN